MIGFCRATEAQAKEALRTELEQERKTNAALESKLAYADRSIETLRQSEQQRNEEGMLLAARLAAKDAALRGCVEALERVRVIGETELRWESAYSKETAPHQVALIAGAALSAAQAALENRS